MNHTKDCDGELLPDGSGTPCTCSGDDEDEAPPGLTVGQLRAALAGVPDSYPVVVRESAGFCGGIVGAAAEDSCAGMQFSIDCSDDPDDFEER